MGPLAYVPFIMVFLKFNDAAYDTRQSVHKLMAVLTYTYILINQAMGGSILMFDAIVFLFVTYFFYRAMSENFEQFSAVGVATIVIFAALILWVAMPAEPVKDAHGNTVESSTEKELKKALETATKALQSQAQPQLDLDK